MLHATFSSLHHILTTVLLIRTGTLLQKVKSFVNFTDRRVILLLLEVGEGLDDGIRVETHVEQGVHTRLIQSLEGITASTKMHF